MKKSVFLYFLILPGFLLNAQSNKEKEPFLTKSLTNESVRNVQVETSGGSISVNGVNPSEARLEVYVSPNNSKDDALSKEEIQKRIDEEYDLKISVNNNKVTAIAKAKDKNINWRRALNISFKIFVPQNVSTDLATSGGSIHLENISGNQDFTTSGGSLHIDNVSGDIKGRTSGGSIHLKNSKDDIDVSTSGGSIEANNCTGKLKLSTSGGSLNLSELNGSINATTSGGNVHADDIRGELFAHTSGGNVALRDLYCSLETSTSGGNINVSIKELGKYVKISNSAGNVDVEIPRNKGVDLKLRASKIKTDALDNFNGTTDDDEIEGKLNGGGIPVTINAGSGRIYLSLK